jgi:hypothetical protein
LTQITVVKGRTGARFDQRLHVVVYMTNQSGTAADSGQRLKNSSMYQEFLAEREEILKHKWLESEKAGYDIGFERALVDWVVKHRSRWRKDRLDHARP